MPRIGIICEGTREGSDAQVLKYFAERIVDAAEIDAVPLGNKPNLFNQCGAVAKSLRKSGCDRILIVWDLLPAWGDDAASAKGDMAKARASLAAAGLERDPCIFRIAINRELETWLVSDGAALSAVIPRPPNSVTVRAIRNPVAESKPKTWLTKKFKEIGRREYMPARNALELARAMPANLRAIRKIPSFKVFEKSLVVPC